MKGLLVALLSASPELAVMDLPRPQANMYDCGAVVYSLKGAIGRAAGGSITADCSLLVTRAQDECRSNGGEEAPYACDNVWVTSRGECVALTRYHFHETRLSILYYNDGSTLLEAQDKAIEFGQLIESTKLTFVDTWCPEAD